MESRKTVLMNLIAGSNGDAELENSRHGVGVGWGGRRGWYK